MEFPGRRALGSTAGLKKAAFKFQGFQGIFAKINMEAAFNFKDFKID